MQAPDFLGYFTLQFAVGTRNALSAISPGINVHSKLILFACTCGPESSCQLTREDSCRTGAPAARYPCVSEKCGRSSLGSSLSIDPSISDRALARAHSIMPCRYRCTGRAVWLALMCCDGLATYPSHRRTVNPYTQVHMSLQDYGTGRRACRQPGRAVRTTQSSRGFHQSLSWLAAVSSRRNAKER
jgi:hypothetical protein